MLFCRTKQIPDIHVKDDCHLTESIKIRLYNVSTPLADGCRVASNLLSQPVYTNLKVYHFLIKKCTTPNRLRRYA